MKKSKYMKVLVLLILLIVTPSCSDDIVNPIKNSKSDDVVVNDKMDSNKDKVFWRWFEANLKRFNDIQDPNGNVFADLGIELKKTTKI